MHPLTLTAHGYSTRGMHHGSATAEIAVHLTRGKHITALEALGVYKVFRLASVINKLRGRGFPIVTTMRSDERGKEYASYCIPAVDSKLNFRGDACKVLGLNRTNATLHIRSDRYPMGTGFTVNCTEVCLPTAAVN